jgi:lysophospholipase L1-like esterase
MRDLLCRILLCFSISAFAALTTVASEPDWENPILFNADYSIDATDSNITHYTKVSGDYWYAAIPYSPVGASTNEAISFEFKGDGSHYYGSVFLSDDKTLLASHEAQFPLDSTNWTSITIPFRDFVQNNRGTSFQLDAASQYINPADIGFIGFGIGRQSTRYFPPSCTFSIRNVQLVESVPDLTPPSYSQGLSKTIAKLEAGEPLKILLLGDSITESGGANSYAAYCANQLLSTYGSQIDVQNQGIGGHTVRGGSIVLPRIKRAVPDPDLVCIFYGANDAPFVNEASGFDQSVFELHLHHLIDKVREGTGGDADILLINGVPRLTSDRSASAGIVEQISDGFAVVATNRNAAFLDTMTNYLAMSTNEWHTYYNDTVHQGAAGLEHIGNLMYNLIEPLATPLVPEVIYEWNFDGDGVSGGTVDSGLTGTDWISNSVQSVKDAAGWNVVAGGDTDVFVNTDEGFMVVDRAVYKEDVRLDFGGVRPQGTLTLDGDSGASPYGTYLSLHDNSNQEVFKLYVRNSGAMQVWTNGVELARQGTDNAGTSSYEFSWDNGLFNLNKQNESGNLLSLSYDFGNTDFAYFRIYQVGTGTPIKLKSLLFNIPGTPSSDPFDAWAALFNLNGGDEALDANPDNDTRDNLAEYGLGGNPTNANDAGILPTIEIMEADGTNYFEYVYRRRLDAAARGLSYEVKNTADLTSGAWSKDYVEVAAGPIDSEFESVTNRIPMEGQSSGFTQLKIEKN